MHNTHVECLAETVTCEGIPVVPLDALHDISAVVGHWGHLAVGLDAGDGR